MSDEWDELELDDDLLGGVDNDYDDFDNPTSNEGKRNPIMTVAAGALEEATSIDTGVKVGSTIIKNALPKGFGTIVDDADSVSKEVVNLYDKAKEEFKEPIKDVKNILNRTLGSSELIPDGIRKKIYDATKEEEETYSESVDPRLLEIQEATNRIFAQAAVSEESHSEAKATFDKEAFKTNVKGQVESNNLLRKLASFNGSIVSEFYKKTLELQFRQYFATKDMLEENRASSKDMLSFLEAIKQNTGLPDIQKTLMSEEYMQSIQDRLTDGFGETASEYMSSFTGKLRENVMSKLSDAMDVVGDVAGGVNEIMDVMSDLDGDTALEMAGATGAGIVIPGLTAKASKKLGKILKKNPELVEKSNNLLYISRNFPMLLDDWLHSKSDNWIVEQIQDIVPDFSGSAVSVTRDVGADGLKAMSFDQLSHTTLNNVIPDYLSRILQQLTEINNGESADRLTYSPDEQRLVSVTDAKESLTKKLSYGTDATSKQYSTDRILSVLDPDGNFNEEQRREIMRVLTKDAGAGQLFSMERYSGSDMFDVEGGDKIAARFRELDDASNKKRSEQLLAMSDASRDLSGGFKESSKFINQANVFGQGDVLREMGLLGTGKDGKVNVNNAELIRTMVSELNVTGDYKDVDLSTLSREFKEAKKKEKEIAEGTRAKKRVADIEDDEVVSTEAASTEEEPSLFASMSERVKNVTLDGLKDDILDQVNKVSNNETVQTVRNSETAQAMSETFEETKSNVMNSEHLETLRSRKREIENDIKSNEHVQRAAEEYNLRADQFADNEYVQAAVQKASEKYLEAEELLAQAKKDAQGLTVESVVEQAKEKFTRENLEKSVSAAAEAVKEKARVTDAKVSKTIRELTVEDVQNFAAKTSDELIRELQDFAEREDVNHITETTKRHIDEVIAKLPTKEQFELVPEQLAETKDYIVALSTDKEMRKDELEKARLTSEEMFEQAWEEFSQRGGELVTPVMETEAYKAAEKLAADKKQQLGQYVSEKKATVEELIPESVKEKANRIKEDGTRNFENVKATFVENGQAVIKHAEEVRDNLLSKVDGDETDVSTVQAAEEHIRDMASNVREMVEGGLGGIRETIQNLSSPEYIRKVLAESKELDDEYDARNSMSEGERILETELAKEVSFDPEMFDKLTEVIKELIPGIPESAHKLMFEDMGDGVLALPVSIVGQDNTGNVGWEQLLNATVEGNEKTVESINAMHASMAEMLVDGENDPLRYSITARLGALIQGTLTGGGNLLKSYTQGIGNMTSSIMGGASGLISRVVGSATEGVSRALFSGKSDIYVKGQTKPALLAKGLVSGWYTDVNTQKTVHKLEDVTGEVVDQNGNIVVTAEEANEGLFILDRGGLGGVAKMISIPLTAAYNLQRDAIGALFSVPTKLIQMVKGTFDKPFDVFVGGESTPRLMAVIFKNGGYISAATGKPLSHPNDIDGEVVDRNGNTILSNDDLKNGIYNRHGIQVGSSRLIGYIKRISKFGFDVTYGAASGLIKAGAKAVTTTASLAAQGTVGVAKGIGRMFGIGKVDSGEGVMGDVGGIEDRLDNIYNFMTARWSIGTNSSVEDIVSQQQEILDELREDNPSADDADGDGDRDGGWRDILQRRKKEQEVGRAPSEAERDGGEEEKKDSGIDKLIAMLMAGIGSLGGVISTGFTALMGSKFLSMFRRGGGGVGVDDLANLADLAPDGSRNTPHSNTPRSTPRTTTGGNKFTRGLRKAKNFGGKLLTGAKNMAGFGEGGRAATAIANTTGRLTSTAANVSARAGSVAANAGAKLAATKVGTKAAEVAAKGAAAKAATRAVAGKVAQKAAGYAAGRVAMRAGMMLLGPVGAVLSAGMLAYDAYQLYDYSKYRMDLEAIEKLRFMQYGVPTDDYDFISMVRRLEDELIGGIKYGDKAKIGITLKEVVLEYAEDFGVNLDDVNQVAGFGDWVSKRFVPVFMTHAAAIRNLDSGADLLDIDDELSEKLKPDFLRAVQFKKEFLAKNNVYGISASPVPGKSVTTGAGGINAYISSLLSSYGQAPGEQTPVPDAVKKDVPKPSEQADAVKQEAGVAPPDSPTLGGKKTKVNLPKDTLGKPDSKRSYKYKGGTYFEEEYGTPVTAAVSGTVRSNKYDRKRGRLLSIEDAEGNVHQYRGLAGFNNGLYSGVQVNKGDVVGKSGAYGDQGDGYLYRVRGTNGDFIKATAVPKSAVKPEAVKPQAKRVASILGAPVTTGAIGGETQMVGNGVLTDANNTFSVEDRQSRREAKKEARRESRGEKMARAAMNLTAKTTARNLSRKEKEEELNFYEATSVEQRDRMIHNQGLMFELLTMVTETITGEEVTIGQSGKIKEPTTPRKTNSFQDPVSLRKNQQ